jgi:hypothetical protein
MKFTPNNITSLAPNEVFVFGSNLAGIHGAGAARIAARKFGATYGEGVGMRGQSYAIPTKDHEIQTMPILRIAPYVEQFLEFAASRSHLTFLVTQVGCGLAGYTPSDIAPLFTSLTIPENVTLPEVFWNP